MKFLNLLLVICILCVSCQEGDDTLLQQNQSISEDKGPIISVPLEEPWLSWDTVGFRHTLNGIGGVVARVLYFEPTAKQQYLDAMSTNNGVVTLEQLLGNQATSIEFLDAFERQYNLASSGSVDGTTVCHPGGFDPSPSPSTRSVGNFPAYLNNILNEHCIELYMPYDYTTIVNNDIITVAHPLNKTISASGLNFHYVEGSNCFGTGYITVKDRPGSQANHYPNLIVVRPNPNTNNGGPSQISGIYCDYTIYDGLNLEDFFEF